MPEIEIDSLQFAFLLALVVTAAGIILGYPKRQDLPRLPLLAATPGVKTAGINVSDLLGIALVFSIYFLFHLSAIGRPQNEVPLERYTPSAIFLSMVAQVTLAGIFVLIVAMRVNVVTFFGLWWRKWASGLRFAFLGLALILLFNFSLQAFGYFEWIEHLLNKTQMQDLVRVLQQTTNPLLLTLLIFSTVIAAPIAEELVFRGYLYPALKHFSGARVAAFCSALLFAAAHNHLPTLLPLFVFGLILSTIYERTGSLWAPIATHALLNGTTVTVQLLERFIHPTSAHIP